VGRRTGHGEAGLEQSTPAGGLVYHLRAVAEFVYDEDVALRYDAAVPVQAGEVEFYLALAREAEALGLRTLEIACGTGRIAVPLARQGVRLVGLDGSSAMLARAREKSAGLDTVEWVEGDMRSFDIGESFGLVIIPAGSFQLLLTTEDQLACLRSIHRHLAPEGRLAFEIENPDIVAMAEWLTARRGTLQRRPQRDYRHPGTGRQVLAWGSLEYHPSQQRYIARGVTEELDNGGQVVSRSYGSPMELRYLYRYETEHLLARSDFEVEAVYGDFSKGEFRGTSPDMIWVARSR